MQMTESEIKTNILQAKDQIAQIPICAQLNGVSIEKVKDILRKQGVDLRTLKGKSSYLIRNKKERPALVPVPDTGKTFSDLINRVSELTAQRDAINNELYEIRAQLIKVMEAIDEGADNGKTDRQ